VCSKLVRNTQQLVFGFGSTTSVDHGNHELSDLALEKTSVDHGIHELSDLAF